MLGNRAVGISIKGWVIACSAGWYLYLSLYTLQILDKSTKIVKNQNKPTQGPSHNYMSENAILLKSGQAWLLPFSLIILFSIL